MASPSSPPAAPRRDTLPLDPVVRAAWLYYVEGLTQADVAHAMGATRARVIALLASAREQGVVRVRIQGTTEAQRELSRALLDRFGLADAIVAPAPVDPARAADVVGHATGRYLADRIVEGMTVGVGWGATLHAALKAVPPAAHARTSVVSLLGGAVQAQAITPFEVAGRLADLIGAECYPFNAPLVVADAAMRATLRAEPALADLVRRSRGADLVVLSVGDVSDAGTLFQAGLVPASELASLRAAGAVGDVLGHFLDASGHAVDHPLNERVMSVELEDLSHRPRVVIAAGGMRKAAAIRAALHALPVAVLITDEPAARALIDG